MGSDATTSFQFNIRNLSGSGIISIQTVANGNINFENGYVNAKNTMDSTSISSGSLRVSGGAGISKSLYVGGDMFVITAQVVV